MSTYNFSSVDPQHYNRIRATIPNHLAIRTVNICVSTLTTNCNIEVMNEQDYIEFEITEDNKTTTHKIFMESYTKISALSLPDIVQNLLEKKDIPIKVSTTNIDTIKFTSEKNFAIIGMSYNMKLLCGLYCLEDSNWPIKSEMKTTKESFYDQKPIHLKTITYGGEYKMRVGDYLEIIPMKNPTNAFGFSCVYINSDASIASIDGNGYVQGLSEGTTEITVEVRNPDTRDYLPPDFTDKFKITVSEAKDVDKISTNHDFTNFRMYKGDSYLLYPEVEPYNANYEIAWTNETPDLITVHNGYITAKAVGDAKIMCKITNKKSPSNIVNFEYRITISSDLISINKYTIQSDTVGYYLSTPILYLLTNVGNHVFFNEMHNSKRLQCGTVCMCLNNSYSASFPIIASQGEIITRCSIGHASDIWFILVDANMKEVKLLNPMYITVSVRPDDSDPATTPGLL